MGKTTMMICLLVFIASVTAFSATLVVPYQYPTIEGAIFAADPGDTITVGPGTWENVSLFIDKNIYIESTHGQYVTFLEGSQELPVVTFWDCGPPTDGSLGIEGFTIKNGWGYLDYDDDYRGGGIYCRYSYPAIRDNCIKHNTANNGAGIYCLSIDSDTPSKPTIEFNTIKYNEPPQGSSGGIGGGIYLNHCYGGMIRSNSITHNKANNSGGGIGVTANPSTGYDIIIEQNYIFNNEAINGQGGGVYLQRTSHDEKKRILKRNTIKRNKAALDGGGIWSNCECEIEHNDISYNLAGSGAGASLGGASWTTTYFINNVIYENTANGSSGNGGGLYSGNETTFYFTNNTYAYNHAPNGTGGGAYADMGLFQNTLAQFENEIFWGNTAGSTSGKQLNYGGSYLPTVNNSDVPWAFGSGNIWIDPEFVENYHLDTASPCKSVGNSGANGVPTEDIDGEPRVQGEGIEMGMDEINEQ